MPTTTPEPHTTTVLSSHKTEAAANRALKKAPGAFIIHEPETRVTNERWLVATTR